MPNTAIIINTVIIIAATSLLGIIALIVYSFMKKEEDTEADKELNSEIYGKILQEADINATTLLNKTQETAAHILSDSRNTNEHVAEELDKVLHMIVQKHITQMNQATDQFQKMQGSLLSELEAKLTEQSKQTASLTESRVSAALETFTQNLMGKSVAGEEKVDQKTKELLAQAEREINEYKKRQIAEIQNQVQELLLKTYRDVLRRSLPEEAQRELILEALEKAKTDGVVTL